MFVKVFLELVEIKVKIVSVLFFIFGFFLVVYYYYIV